MYITKPKSINDQVLYILFIISKKHTIIFVSKGGYKCMTYHFFSIITNAICKYDFFFFLHSSPNTQRSWSRIKAKNIIWFMLLAFFIPLIFSAFSREELGRNVVQKMLSRWYNYSRRRWAFSHFFLFRKKQIYRRHETRFDKSMFK